MIRKEHEDIHKKFILEKVNSYFSSYFFRFFLLRVFINNRHSSILFKNKNAKYDCQ